MLGEDGGVVDDGAVFGVVYHIHGNELGAEWQHIQIRFKRLVLLQDLQRKSTNCITVKPPMKDTPKEDKPPNKGQTKSTLF